MPGLNNYQVLIANVFNTFKFNVDAAGNVISQNTIAAQGDGSTSTLEFNTTVVDVDPMAYTGTYVVPKNGAGRFFGPESFTLLSGLNNYEVLIASVFNKFSFNVDAAG